ncbi:hypothetical protein [Candidatus Sodalis endolongispinus]|uniref:hypothetical protein n=1 Tax=Candidatus Sodalis endolongispinus TaxID=2812662 RepID=UPI001FEBF4BC|nr:hypothetical protein [Candidatus Sodalis endolongispinus]
MLIDDVSDKRGKQIRRHSALEHHKMRNGLRHAFIPFGQPVGFFAAVVKKLCRHDPLVLTQWR